jgi:hypothetical protein
MKSAYELAMERLSKTAPVVKLSADQKKRIAELEAEYKARVADREIFLVGQLEKAREKGSFEEVEQFERQLVSDRKSWQAELEEKKAQIRREGAK